MRRIIAFAIAAMLLLGLAPAYAEQAAKELNIFTWTYYIPDEVVDDFEAETGIHVNYTTFSSNEEMLTKLMATGGGQYDIILCSDYIIETMVKQGAGTPEQPGTPLLMELDKTRIANYANINPAFQSQYYDPDNKYTIPYAAGSPMIVYDKEKVGFEIKGYADLWDPRLANNVVVVDDMRNIIGITAKILGMSFNETDPAKLAQIGEELMKLRGNIVKFDADTPHNTMIAGDATVGFMFGSQIVAALAEMPALSVVYPQEGMGFGIDNLVVPAQAPHVDSVYVFLNYILDGKVSAKASDLIDYTNCNTAAVPFLSEEFANNPAINIPSEALVGAEMVIDVGEATALYDEMWTRFKAYTP